MLEYFRQLKHRWQLFLQSQSSINQVPRVMHTREQPVDLPFKLIHLCR